MPYKSIIIIAALVAIFAVSCGGGGEASPTATARPEPQPTQPPQPASGGGKVVRVENWDIGGSGEYKFIPSEFSFAVGETATFKLSAETEFHTFTVEDLGIDVTIDAGETVDFTYTFEQAGSFDLICIPHLAFDMTGTIVVQ